MTWEVICRDKNGNQTSSIFDADNREELFKTLSSKGIVPIRIKESVGAKHKRNLHPFLLVAGVVSLALVGVVLLTSDRSQRRPITPVKDTKNSQIKETRPHRIYRSESDVAQIPEDKPHSNIPPEQQVMHTNLYGYVINRPHTAVVITNKVDDADKPLEERIFSNSADQKIASLLLIKPGEMLIGDSSSLFGKGFTRAFLKSIETPIVIDEDDDELTAELKRAVRETKIEIKARYDAGDDIGELMAKERDELQAIGLYREDLKDQIAKLARDKALREEDMEDFVKAANKMLEDRGGAPLQMPRFAARRFLLERQRGNGNLNIQNEDY